MPPVSKYPDLTGGRPLHITSARVHFEIYWEMTIFEIYWEMTIFLDLLGDDNFTMYKFINSLEKDYQGARGRKWFIRVNYESNR